MSRDPAKSRPLSANVKRMMWLERAAPRNKNVISSARVFTDNDKIYCHKQGNLFMEAAAMGIEMSEFAPMFMQSQLAGVIDYNFSSSNGITHSISDLLKIPALMQNPRAVIESLYWIEDILSKAEETENKSLYLAKAYEADTRYTPKALLELPDTENHNIEKLSYAYWLGYIYRCECILHDESSRMVYSAFEETIMKSAFSEMLISPLNDSNLSDCALEICDGLDKLLVEKIWPAKGQKKYI